MYSKEYAKGYADALRVVAVSLWGASIRNSDDAIDVVQKVETAFQITRKVQIQSNTNPAEEGF